MIEGRSGGSGRGTRRELWAPPDRGSAQPADRTLYRVPTLDPRRPLISSPPPLPHPPPLPPATGKKFPRTRPPVHPALLPPKLPGPKENGPRGEPGDRAG